MGNLKINILNPKINLMANLTSVSNSCSTIWEFDVITTKGATISVYVNPINGNSEDFDVIRIDIGVNTYLIPAGTTQFNLPEGRAMITVAIGNVYDNIITNGAGTCNETSVSISDLTNKERAVRTFMRCSTEDRCPTPTYEEYENNIYNTEIDPDTNIVIYADGSGTMNSSLTPIQNAIQNELKTALLPYYNNDSALYDSKVTFSVISDIADPLYERPLKWLNYNGQNLTGKVIAMAFVDEADTYTGGTAFNAYAERAPDYDDDLALLRQRLLGFANNYYHGTLFQVTDDSLDGTNFKELMIACKNGIGRYSSTNGLSDKDNVSVKYDINDGDTSTYYKDLIVSALQDFGFTI